MMNRHDGSSRPLWLSIPVALAYVALIDRLPAPVHTDLLRGSIGVILGLYICSHPAANAVNVLFFDRGNFRQLRSGWTVLGWLALNAMVVLLGWLVITSGMTRLVRPAN